MENAVSKKIDRAFKDKLELSEEYNVPISGIVWMGGNRYIIAKDGKETVVEKG